MSDDSAAFRDFIRQKAPTTTGTQAHEGYTGATHTHYGLTIPVMRAFVSDWVAERKKMLAMEDWLGTMDALYNGESVEEKIFGGMLLASFPKLRQKLPLEKLAGWLGQLVGWAEVDNTCQSMFKAQEMLARWEEWKPFLEQLALDSNINKRRAGLVLLIRPLRESADERIQRLALAQVDTLKGERDKLITKAISWLLREGIKLHREAISAYLDANAALLPAIAVRETRTKLIKGKK